MVNGMEVKQAEAFIAVAEELHFGRAADRLRIAQPPLSRMIKQLERHLGAELFIRSTRHVELTATGKALIEPAHNLVAASHEAIQTVLDARDGKIGHVRMGFAGASTYRSIGAIVRQLRRQQPGLTLDVQSSMFSPDGIQKVLNKELDIAIGRWDFLPPDVDSHVMAEEDVIIAVPPTHALANEPKIRIKDLAHDPWVSLPVGFGSALQNRLTNLAIAAGFVPRIVQTAPDSWALMVLVGVETGCAVTVSSVRDNLPDPGVRFKQLADSPNPPLEVRLIWRKDNLTPAVKAAVDIAKGLFPAPNNRAHSE